MDQESTAFKLDKLDNGRTLERINKDIGILQQALTDLADHYGPEAAKSKGMLTFKLSLICVDPANAQFSVKCESNVSLPNRPADVTVAFLGEDDDGKPKMSVRPFPLRPGDKNKGPRLFDKLQPSPETGLAENETLDMQTGEVCLTS